MLLYSFACYTSRFQWAWAVKEAPFSLNTSPSNGEASLQLAKLLAPLRVGARVPRRSKARLSWQVVHSADRMTPKGELPKTACVPSVPSSLCAQAFQGTLPSARWCSGSHWLFPFQCFRFTASSVPQPRASGQFALTCPQTWPLSSSDNPASVASKPNTGCVYLKMALWFHHPFIHFRYKNNTLFYLWV